MTAFDKLVAVFVAVLIPGMLVVGGEFLYHRERPNIKARKPWLFAGTTVLQSIHLFAVLMRNEHLYDVFAPQVFEFDHCLFWDYWIKNTAFNLWVVALNYRIYFYGTLEAEVTIDKRNFSKKILAMKILHKLQEKEKSSSRKGAFYYEFDENRYEELVSQGFNFLM